MTESHATASGFPTLYIFGSGGFGRELAWLATQAWNETADIQFLVSDSQYLREPVNGFPVSLLAALEARQEAKYLVSLGNPVLREAFTRQCEAAGLRPATLVHPGVQKSPWVETGAGTVICAGCVITCNIRIGVHVQINLNCTVGHDTTIGDYSTLSPGVHISGNVQLGRRVFVGTNACVINGQPDAPLVIGDDAIIAAGACVTRSVPPKALVAGVPAIQKR